MAQYWDSIKVKGVELFIQIHTENRKSTRASFGKDFILIRIPSYMPSIVRKSSIEKMKSWVIETLSRKPDLLNRYKIRDYHKNNTLTVMDIDLLIHIERTNRKSGKGQMKDNNLIITLPEGMDGFNERIMTRTLISRTIAKSFKAEIERMIDRINEQHFNEKIKSINLKYNTSNWGSCSTQRNINLSTRLLLAPKWVIEYVIVHEMSHLREMNHSKRFWAIVEKACPDYLKAEKWLKIHGSKCYF